MDRLQKLQEISALLNSTLNPTEIRKGAIEAATALMDADVGALLLLDEKADELYFDVALGEKGDKVSQVRLKMGEGIAGSVAKDRTPVIVNDVQNDPRFSNRSDRKADFTTRNMVCIPILAKDKLIGVLQAVNKKGNGSFDEEDLRIFISLGHQVGIAIENANLYTEINSLLEGVLLASVSSMESRDPTTSGHSERVAMLSCEFARVVDHLHDGPYAAMTFSPAEMKELRYAALLHDVGKFAVREQVLVKAAKMLPSDIALLHARFDYIRRTQEWETEKRKCALLESGGAKELLAKIDAKLVQERDNLNAMFKFILECNTPAILPRGGFEQLSDIAKINYDYFGESKPYLTQQDIDLLSIPKGSLTAEERLEIESHVTHTYLFLSRIPWTASLKNVPIIAYNHHEKQDGSGYPNKAISIGIPIQARMMTISDIYDALTASDRPYKTAVPIPKAFDILTEEAKNGKIEGALLEIFIESKAYLITQNS